MRVTETSSTATAARTEAGRSQAPRSFHPRLEAARGVAALLVVLSHCLGAVMSFRLDLSIGQQADAWGIVTRIAMPLVNGSGAVLFFFVLSGFVLSQSIGSEREMSPASYGAYAIRRILRLWPAHLVVMCLAIAVLILMRNLAPTPLTAFADDFAPGQRHLAEAYVNGGALPSSWTGFAANAALTAWSINPVTWSLAVEVVASVFMPALTAVALLRSDINKLLVLLALVGTAFAVGYSNYYLLYAFTFYGGCLVHSYGAPVVARLSGAVGERGLLIVAALLFLVPQLLVQNRPIIVLLWEGIASWLIVAFLVARPTAPSAAVLDTAAARFVGRVSYSLYLFHFVVIVVLLRGLHEVWGEVPSRLTQVVSLLPFTAVVLVVSLAGSAALYRYVERPGISLGRGLQRRLVLPPAADPAP